MRLLCTLSLLLVFVPGLSGQGPTAASLRLRPGDAIRLEVGDAPELSADYSVSQSGEVLLPMIGLVAVAGRPFDEVHTGIRTAYARELHDVPVLITPVLRIAVLGAVRLPGLISADPTFTLADVIASAGGVTESGNPGRITLLREGESLRFSLDDSSELLSRPVQPGDQLLVARHGWLRENLGIFVGAAASVVAAAITSLILR